MITGMLNNAGWHVNHVWSYDFVHERTYDGRVFRTLNIIDQFSKEVLMIRVNRKLQFH